MMWYAHRCTIYDNVVKDEIAREIIPRKIEIPHIEVKIPGPTQAPQEVVERRDASSETKPERVTIEPQLSPGEVPQTPTPAPKPEQPPAEQPTLEAPKPMRSREAEEALKRLREKWMRNGG